VGKGYFDTFKDDEPESHDVDPREEPPAPAEGSQTQNAPEDTPEDDEPSEAESEPSTRGDPRLELVELFQRLILSDVHQAKSIYILGKRGCGKTFDTNELAKLFMEHGWRVHTVCPVSSKISAHVQYSPINSPGGSMLDAAYIGALDDVMEGHRVLIAVDEVDQFCSVHKMEDVLKDVINYGRHLHIWFLCNSL
jgi:Cdc6-like AAA superfamily ATPase